MPRGIYDRKKAAKPQGKRKFGSVAKKAAAEAVSTVVTRNQEPKVVSIAKYQDLKTKAVSALTLASRRIESIIRNSTGDELNTTDAMALGYTAHTMIEEAKEISQF